MKYVIYLRTSTKKQDSRTQLDMCLQFLEKTVGKEFKYEIFTDEITSKKALNKREGIRQALHAINTGDVLVGQRVDRLSRNSYETHFIKHFLDAKEADLMMTCQPGIKNKVIFGTYIGMAEEEVMLLRERIRDKLKTKKRRGERIGTVQYGYELDQENLILVNGPEGTKVKKPGIMIEHEHERKALDFMIKAYEEGNSYRKIAKLLSENGYKNRRGNDFQAMSIHKILRQTGRQRKRILAPENIKMKRLRELSKEFLGLCDRA